MAPEQETFSVRWVMNDRKNALNKESLWYYSACKNAIDHCNLDSFLKTIYKQLIQQRQEKKFSMSPSLLGMFILMEKDVGESEGRKEEKNKRIHDAWNLTDSNRIDSKTLL